MMIVIKRLWIQLTADRKRFAALCTCAAAGLLLWARLILVSDMPRTVLADPDSGEVGAIGGDGDGRTAPDRGANSAHYQRGVSQIITLDVNPRRDPFELPSQIFPKPIKTNGNGEGTLTPATGQSEIHLAKHIELLREQVRSYKLGGSLPEHGLALINGETYSQGDVVFTSELGINVVLGDIDQRHVTLIIGNHRESLRMSNPGD